MVAHCVFDIINEEGVKYEKIDDVYTLSKVEDFKGDSDEKKTVEKVSE